jgi:hypothetical protein
MNAVPLALAEYPVAHIAPAMHPWPTCTTTELLAEDTRTRKRPRYAVDSVIPLAQHAIRSAGVGDASGQEALAMYARA